MSLGDLFLHASARNCNFTYQTKKLTAKTVDDVGSLEKRSNQLTYEEPKNKKTKDYTAKLIITPSLALYWLLDRIGKKETLKITKLQTVQYH